MKLIFEKGAKGRGLSLLPKCDVPVVMPTEQRESAPHLAEMSENDISRHFTELAQNTHGVNNGFYPLGSCTMKYNPKINETAAAMEGFTAMHPLQPAETVQGCLEALHICTEYLTEITGMDYMTFQPAAGAHGEFCGLLLIKAYHADRGDTKRTKIIVPDSAHGTNPASAAMAGFEVVTVPSDEHGGVDIEKLRETVGDDVAGLMLTNPNTVGLFDENILEITRIIHECGGLNYYDGANLNAVMGIVRPGDMGFDVVHINLHKTFAAPHGGGGPGSGPVGCKKILAPFLPDYAEKTADGFRMTKGEKSIGRVKSFYGNFLVVVRALTYVMTLGKKGIPEAAGHAVLNANYMMKRLSASYNMAYDRICMHEFVMCLEDLKKETGVTALDIAKGLLDNGIHPPTMYFPLIVHEALMLEPTETESLETMDRAIDILIELRKTAEKNPDELHTSPHKTIIGRPDELKAARTPVLRYVWDC